MVTTHFSDRYDPDLICFEETLKVSPRAAKGMIDYGLMNFAAWVIAKRRYDEAVAQRDAWVRDGMMPELVANESGE